MKKHYNLNCPNCTQWRFWSACANAQADLNLHRALIIEGTFSDILAPFKINTIKIFSDWCFCYLIQREMYSGNWISEGILILKVLYCKSTLCLVLKTMKIKGELLYIQENQLCQIVFPPFWKRIYCKRNVYDPLGASLFLLEYMSTLFQKGLDLRESKQRLLCKIAMWSPPVPKYLSHDLRLFDFVCFLFLLVSGKGCGLGRGLWLWHSLDFYLSLFLWLWHSLDFSLTLCFEYNVLNDLSDRWKLVVLFT